MSRLEKIKELFDQASDLPPDKRAAFLNTTTADDPLLRAEVETLLAAEAQVGSFLAQPALIAPDDEPQMQSQAGRIVGHYQLLSEIGRGGMATVYLAERIDGTYQQQVALKLVRSGADNDEISRRFKQERQILARLEHPNIARLFDGGTTDDGRPYLVMEHIAGKPITQYCRQRRLALAERLRLFQTVCAAVAYAHRNLIVHRDIKPSNILVTDGGVVKLLDFGIAKLLAPEPEQVAHTVTGLRLMTPEYASPEQMREEQITTATDIYSLGVLLYELLTGVHPHELDGRPIYEITRLICEEDPPLPSTKALYSNDPGSSESPAKLRRTLRGDLDNITMLALRKDARQRYETVEQMTEDLRRHLSGEPVSARAATLAYRASRYVRKHRFGVAMIALLIALTLGFIGYLLNESVRARQKAEEQHRQLYIAAMKDALQSWREDDLVQMDAALAQGEPKAGEEDLRGFEWRYLWRLAHTEALTLPEARGGQYMYFINHPKTNGRPSKCLLTSDEPDLLFHVWDLATGKTLRSFSAPVLPPLMDSENSDDMLETYQQTDDHTIAFRGIVTGEPRGTITDPTSKINRFARATNPLFVTGHADGTVKVWNHQTGQAVAVLKATNLMMNLFDIVGPLPQTDDQNGVSLLMDLLTSGRNDFVSAQAPALILNILTRDGRYLVTQREGEDVKIWNVSTLRLVSFLPATISISPLPTVLLDNRLATAGSDGLVQVWDLKTGRSVAKFRGHTSYANNLSAAPNGKLLVSWGEDKTVRLWDIATQRGLAVLKDSMRGATKLVVAFSADGRRLAIGAADRPVKIWEVDSLLHPPPRVLNGHQNYIFSVAVSPDGKLVASASEDQTVRLWNAQTGECKVLDGHGYPVWSVAFAADGKTFASGGYDGRVILWEAATGRRLATFSHGAAQDLTRQDIAYRYGVRGLAFSPDGRTLASASRDGTVKLWDLATGQEIGSLRGHLGVVATVAFSPDGRWIATGGEDATARLWKVATKTEIKIFRGHQQWVGSVKFSPDGNTLATSSQDGTARLWNVQTGDLLHEFKGHIGEVFCVAFSPDGKRLVTAGKDHKIKFWDVARALEVFTLKDHTEQVWSIAFSKDGELMASGGFDKTVRLWRAASDQDLPQHTRQ